MLVVDGNVAPVLLNMDSGGYGSRLALRLAGTTRFFQTLRIVGQAKVRLRRAHQKNLTAVSLVGALGTLGFSRPYELRAVRYSTLPGFMMPSGSSIALMERISSIATLSFT